MEIYNTIEEAIKAQGLTITSAIKKCGLANGITTKIKQRKHLSDDTLHKLAIGLNLPNIDPYSQAEYPDEEVKLLSYYRQLSEMGKAYAINQIKDLYNAEIAKDYNTITLKHSLFKVSAGIGEPLTDTDNWEDIVVSLTPLSRKADYALTISGDSMQPDFNNGDIVLVREQPAVNVGDICVYTLAGKGYIKKFDGDRLISLNPNYEDIILSEYSIDDIKCNGLVLGKL